MFDALPFEVVVDCASHLPATLPRTDLALLLGLRADIRRQAIVHFPVLADFVRAHRACDCARIAAWVRYSVAHAHYSRGVWALRIDPYRRPPIGGAGWPPTASMATIETVVGACSSLNTLILHTMDQLPRLRQKWRVALRSFEVGTASLAVCDTTFTAPIVRQLVLLFHANLTFLELDGYIRAECFDTLARGLCQTRVSTLHLNLTTLDDARPLLGRRCSLCAVLAKLPTLARVDLVEEHADDLLAAVAVNPCVRALRYRGVAGEAALALVGRSEVETLVLHEVRIGVLDVARLVPPAVRELRLDTNKLGCHEGIALGDVLRFMPCLTTFELRGNEVGTLALKVIANGLRAAPLRHLALDGVDLLGAASPRFFVHNGTVVYDVARSAWSEVGRLVCECASLEHVSLTGNVLDATACDALAREMRSRPVPLASLDLTWSDVHDLAALRAVAVHVDCLKTPDHN